MKEIIQERLTEVEREHGFRILYACESGSRAWGFASEDSDYDIRFLYVWPRDHYLGVYDPQDMFDYGVDAQDLDLTGWDIRKALPLFRKANGSLMEWLFSPEVYFENEEVMSHWRELAKDYFVPRNSAAHYLGLSRKINGEIREKGKVTAKKYLYVLRALLSAQFVAEQQQAVPVEFAQLRNSLELPVEVTAEIDQMISEKSGGKESDGIERNRVLDEFVDTRTDEVGAQIPDLSGDLGTVDRLNEFFREVITS